ncbi:thiol reductant ABC exporter subunit CydC [Desulfurivibrio alkaliphilus]|uniref:ABC transporter, CydDC cysteine exporter (CydDC-E) family, permease/ATP-binding protein CydC n=1 Tax=Desulfurivibrio alkaliphilus (strain DSM 19089 / UNIQEM U267 / AHT2) TaxID=589865 RepID=D6Z1S2_DESAT|nr:thiol reductant ABC exporter subunit CydC [Desulfurivibrio alkaliphilus]ADH85497.1 ABC transporter, CydDC cysteine exporter (CydDC-E) family, permease/ATP-binding protein CydC [Desulfurivibrio alkaliphilus AHT 2]
MRTNGNFSVFLRLLSLSAPEWPRLLAGVAAAVLTLLSNAALLAVAAWFLASMALAGVSGVPFNYHLPAGAIRTLALLRVAGRYGERLLSHAGTLRLLTRLRTYFFQRLEPLAPAGLADWHSADLFSRLKVDIDQLDRFYLHFLLPVAAAGLVLSALGLFFYCFSPLLAAGLLLLWLFAGAVLPTATLYLGRRPSRRKEQLATELRVGVVELVRGLEELLVLGRSQEMVARLQRTNRLLWREQRRSAALSALTEGGLALLAGLALPLVLTVTVPLVAAGEVAGPYLPLLAVLALVSFESVGQVPAAMQAWGGIERAARRLWAVSEQPAPVPEPPVPAPPPTTWSLEFKEVWFTYPAGRQPVLRGADFRIQAGEKIALVGEVGAGKSSVLNLLLRFYPYQQGAIRLGDKGLETYQSKQLRSWFAVVPQHPYLFNATIHENLLLARPDADDAELHRALAAACLGPWLESLPAGLETVVGSAGCRLSGGQLRRLAMARAIVKNAPVWLLDEPTEGLDQETEALLQTSLATILATKTVLLITHRSSGLAFMDRVLHLSEGRINTMTTA